MAPFVQRADVKAAGLVPVFDALYAVECVLIITGTMLALLVIRYRARLMFHSNLSRILTNVLFHYAVLAPLGRGAIIALMLDWDNAGYASIFVPLLGVTVPNIAAILLFVYCHRCTMEFHKSLPDELPAKLIRMYSLSLRYQTLENVRVAKLIKRVYFLAFALFACLVSIFVFATYAPDKRAEIVAMQCFDIGIALLAIAVPLACLCQIDRIPSSSSSLCCARRCRVANRKNVASVKSSLDSALDCTLDEEGRVYFAQLERMWA